MWELLLTQADMMVIVRPRSRNFGLNFERNLRCGLMSWINIFCWSLMVLGE